MLRAGLAGEGDDIAHDRVELKIFRSVDRRDAEILELFGIVRWDDAADNTGMSLAAVRIEALHDVAHERYVAAREDREADDVDAFVDGGAGDLAGVRRMPS